MARTPRCCKMLRLDRLLGRVESVGQRMAGRAYCHRYLRLTAESKLTCVKMRRSLLVKVMLQLCATFCCRPGASTTPARRMKCRGCSPVMRTKPASSSCVATLSAIAPRCLLTHFSSHSRRDLRFSVEKCDAWLTIHYRCTTFSLCVRVRLYFYYRAQALL